MIPVNNKGCLTSRRNFFKFTSAYFEGSHNNNLVSLNMNFLVLYECSYHCKVIVADNNNLFKLNGFHVVFNLVNVQLAWN